MTEFYGYLTNEGMPRRMVMLPQGDIMMLDAGEAVQSLEHVEMVVFLGNPGDVLRAPAVAAMLGVLSKKCWGDHGRAMRAAERRLRAVFSFDTAEELRLEVTLGEDSKGGGMLRVQDMDRGETYLDDDDFCGGAEQDWARRFVGVLTSLYGGCVKVKWNIKKP